MENIFFGQFLIFLTSVNWFELRFSRRFYWYSYRKARTVLPPPPSQFYWEFGHLPPFFKKPNPPRGFNVHFIKVQESLYELYMPLFICEVAEFTRTVQYNYNIYLPTVQSTDEIVFFQLACWNTLTIWHKRKS